MARELQSQKCEERHVLVGHVFSYLEAQGLGKDRELGADVAVANDAQRLATNLIAARGAVSGCSTQLGHAFIGIVV